MLLYPAYFGKFYHLCYENEISIITLGQSLRDHWMSEVQITISLDKFLIQTF